MGLSDIDIARGARMKPIAPAFSDSVHAWNAV